jgi:hypothetical protein
LAVATIVGIAKQIKRSIQPQGPTSSLILHCDQTCDGERTQGMLLEPPINDGRVQIIASPPLQIPLPLCIIDNEDNESRKVIMNTPIIISEVEYEHKYSPEEQQSSFESVNESVGAASTTTIIDQDNVNCDDDVDFNRKSLSVSVIS